MALIPVNDCDKCMQIVTNSASLRFGVRKSCKIDNDVVFFEASPVSHRFEGAALGAFLFVL